MSKTSQDIRKGTICATILLAALSLSPNSAKANEFANGNESEVQTPVKTNAKPHRRSSAIVHIDAAPEIVWRAIHDERAHDPDISESKVLSACENESTLEQKFQMLPIVGAATCIFHEKEVPGKRIDYELVSSDHCKAMEGSWVIVPGVDGKSTDLELSSYFDPGFPIPVPRFVIDTFTTQKIQKRLNNVKRAAEAERAQLSQAIKPEATKSEATKLEAMKSDALKLEAVKAEAVKK